MAIFLVIVSQASFAALSGLVKAASNAGLSSQEILFFQSLFAMAIHLPWILKDGLRVFAPKNIALIAARSLCGVLFLYLFYMSVRLVPLVNAVLLQNTAPLFIPIIAFIMFRKKITIEVLLVMLAGFIGVVLVLNPGRGFLQPGDIFALSAGLVSALGTILLGLLEKRGENSKTIMLYYLAILVVVAGSFSINGWVTPRGLVWIYLAGAGFFYGAYMFLLMASLKRASPVVIAPFIYLGVVFSGVVDWVVWKQYPDPMTIVGASVIIAAAMISAVHKKRRTAY